FRSHFMAYHESFYRYVEAQSVTPFSLPALDRSLASVVVGMIRHLGSPRLAAPLGAGAVELIRAAKDQVADVLAERARAQPDRGRPPLDHHVWGRSRGLVDKWQQVVTPTDRSRGSKADYCYSPFEQRRARANALLRTPEDDATKQEIPRRDPQYPFVAPTSMRDVEPSVAIWMRRRPQQGED